MVHSGGSEVIDSASHPNAPSSPNIMRNTVIGAFAGLLIAAVYFIISSLLNDVVTSEEELANDFGLPVLGVIPQIELNSDGNSGKEQKHEKKE